MQKKELYKVTFDKKELEAVNAILQRQGKLQFWRPFPRNGSSSNSSSAGSSTGSFSGKCPFCKKSGHLQKHCSDRITAQAPMVDKDRKPYTRNVSAFTSTNAATNALTSASPGGHANLQISEPSVDFHLHFFKPVDGLDGAPSPGQVFKVCYISSFYYM